MAQARWICPASRVPASLLHTLCNAHCNTPNVFVGLGLHCWMCSESDAQGLEDVRTIANDYAMKYAGNEIIRSIAIQSKWRQSIGRLKP
jgi:hypothetical protein